MRSPSLGAVPWIDARKSECVFAAVMAVKEDLRCERTAGLKEERGVLRIVLEGVPPPAWAGGGSCEGG